MKHRLGDTILVAEPISPAMSNEDFARAIAGLAPRLKQRAILVTKDTIEEHNASR